MHWIERQKARTRIGEELQRRGWKIFGYTEDKSDPMTDYYAPTSWDGVATHPDHPNVVVCVDVIDYLIRDKSGQGDWPTFHATPHGKTWHVECDGQIVKTGTGLQRCARWGEEGQVATEALVDKIGAVVSGDNPGHTQVAATGEGYTIEHDREWTWIRFASKPSEAVREALREQLGARWGRRRRAWYIKEHVEAETIIAVIASATD
jgi:hypothetical protein